MPQAPPRTPLLPTYSYGHQLAPYINEKATGRVIHRTDGLGGSAGSCASVAISRSAIPENPGLPGA